MKPYDFNICGGGLQRANFLGAALAAVGGAIGGLFSGGASVLAGLGEGILGGVGGLASGIGGAASGLIGGGKSVLGGVTSATIGASKSLADIITTTGGQVKGATESVLGIYQMFHTPEKQITLPASSGTIQTPSIGIPTLAATLPQQQQAGQTVFTTPNTKSAAQSDYLPFIAIGGLILFWFLRKK